MLFSHCAFSYYDFCSIILYSSYILLIIQSAYTSSFSSPELHPSFEIHSCWQTWIVVIVKLGIGQRHQTSINKLHPSVKWLTCRFLDYTCRYLLYMSISRQQNNSLSIYYWSFNVFIPYRGISNLCLKHYSNFLRIIID